MKKIIFFAFIISALMRVSEIKAQKYLTLEEAVNIAKEKNGHVKLSEFATKKSNADFHQTDAIFLPQISLGYTAMTTNNPLNAFGFLLHQENVTQQDFDPAKLNDPGARQNYNTEFTAKLPLFNLDMIYARKGAKAQEQAMKYKEERTKEYIEYEVHKAYYGLQMAYNAYEILTKSLNDINEIYKNSENFLNQGLIQKSDLLNVMVQVNTIEAALEKSKGNIKDASDGLRFLMGEEIGGEVFEVPPLEYKAKIESNSFLSLSRADFMAMEKAVDATNMMLKSSKMAFLPRVNAFGNYSLNDKKAFKFGHNSYFAGINLSWDIFSGNQNRSKMKSAFYQYSSMKQELDIYINKEKMELEKAKRDLDVAKLEIKKLDASVNYATEALRILQNRYDLGLSNTNDLLLAQAQLSQQKLLKSQAIMNYNIQEAYTQFLSKK